MDWTMTSMQDFFRHRTQQGGQEGSISSGSHANDMRTLVLSLLQNGFGNVISGDHQNFRDDPLLERFGWKEAAYFAAGQLYLRGFLIGRQRLSRGMFFKVRRFWSHFWEYMKHTEESPLR